jgi:5'-nucleotidase
MRKLILGGIVALSIAACTDEVTTPAADPADPAHADGRRGEVSYWLTLLHNNDGESELLEASQGSPDFGGVARFATLVDDLREEAGGPGNGCRDQGTAVCRGTVLVSSGDNYLAGPEFNASLARGVPYFDAIALDLIGYDALAIGNHEFDFGPDVLADFIESFGRGGGERFLSANLDFSGEPRLSALERRQRIAGSAVVNRGGRRIGIVGATTTDLPFISSPRNVIANAVAPAVQREVDQLTRGGVEIIVLISHLQSISADLALLPMLRNVDIAVAGGGDDLLANSDDVLIPGDVAVGPYPRNVTDADGITVPVITTSGSYNYVGRLIAGFDRAGNLITVDDRSGPVRVAGGANPDAVAPDPKVQAQVVDPVQVSIQALAANIIATSGVALDGRRTQIRAVETNEGNLVADALLWQANQLAGGFGVAPAQVALQNGGGIRNDGIIPPGPFSELRTFDILPFLNFVAIANNIPRAQFKEMLENAVSRVEFGDGRFAQIAGFEFVWDPAGIAQVLDADAAVVTPGTRVRHVELDDGTIIVQNGAVLPGAGIQVASIDFLARGGDQYPFRGAPFTSLGVTYQQALRNYIVSGLGASITAAQYPEGGEGRITRVP